MKNIKFYSLIFISLIVVIFTGCQKEDAETYALPPVSSMDMDFSAFTSLQKAATVDTTSNFKFAKAVVTYWSGIAAVHSILPVTAFKKAVGVTPTKTTRGTWVWTYNFAIGSSSYISTIEATINTEEDSVSWVLSIAQVETSASFTYCTGKSAVDKSGGWWKLYYPEQYVGVPYLKIDWMYTNENEASIRYTNILNGSEDKGGYIEFGKDTDVDFNRYFKIYLVNYSVNTSLNGKVVTIDWNSADKSGQVSINNDIYCCWDSNLYNKISCQ